MKRANTSSHDIKIDPRYSFDLTIKFLQEAPLDCDDPAYQTFKLQQYGENRIEKMSQQDKLSNSCMDTGFLIVVENGKYFMTKDTEDLTHFHAMACREYTLPRQDGASQPKGWIQRTPKLDPY